ncbi:glyoxylase-like metal-dependent hydrolase (beta-lactamase superfamily II) [Streptomyces sp. Ag109_O5-1]|uniref:MBL fold metallo-hydrolase n=1 Tax=Streptomyces sp. Ag109_O5-1 TaxID=1938851 RepID=UPI000FAF0B0A|nr:MBL fold metallo-hydrolase [Streptomyces sp. Ag109_O5-1]RPE42410.1 glyoxylase-like metal-dependent hydrolase (beta-lactamase superfamily II) [Streptomyces sp. Ag109_O5-1]
MNDSRLRRPSAVRTLRVGELKVSYVPDGAMLLKPAGSLPTDPDRHRAGYGAYLNDTRRLVANTGGLLVEHGGRALLIDAGFGPRAVPEEPGHPHRGAVHGGALPGNLALLGRPPQDIETVAFTHLHPDHIGWARVEPTLFTRAAFMVPKGEWDHRGPAATAMESRTRLVLPGEEIFPGVHALALPGHTAGHTGFVIASRGTRLLAFGDALLSPLQVRHPEWSAGHDDDPAQSERHRRRLIAELGRPDTLGFGIHFADVVFGRVRPHVEGAAWQPL